MNIALFEVGLAIGDADGGDRAIAVEVDVVFEKRREAMVRLDAVELNLVSIIVRIQGRKGLVVFNSQCRRSRVGLCQCVPEHRCLLPT